VQLVYSRSSTVAQSLLRQRHILTEAGLLTRGVGKTRATRYKGLSLARSAGQS